MVKLRQEKGYMTHIYSYSKNRLIYFSIMVFITMQLAAQGNLHKATFTGKDMFGTAAFLQNKQIVEDYKGQKILFYTNHDNINAFFTGKGVVYRVTKATGNENDDKDKTKNKEKQHGKESYEEIKKQVRASNAGEEDGIPVKTSTVTMEWIGANPNVEVKMGEKKQGYYTYLKEESSSYKTVITEGYKTITYKDLYPGIDVVYSFPEKGGMEYNLIVQPGADVTSVKMSWSGIEIIKKDAEGNILIQTGSGDILEHAPVSFSENGAEVASGFNVKGKDVKFNFPKGYNLNQKLTIDPWVSVLTTLSPTNLGMNVDYDFQGDLFVYGAGPQNDQDTTNNFKVAKYAPGGGFLWVFYGMVPSVSWSTVTYDPTTLASIYVDPSNFIVDKVTGKVYVGQSLEVNGTQVIRLNQSGAYDNFISAADSTFREDWGLVYRCTDASVLALGGGINSAINMGIINTTNGTVTTSNITGDQFDTDQDIVCGVYDSSGNLYVIMNDIIPGVLPYTNTIYRVNNAFNGNVWAANSNFITFNEANNNPYWDMFPTSGANGNWFNCLAANGSYLYYYDGQDVAAYSFTNGAQVGNTYAVPGYNTLNQGGIAVDNCNHVYVGGIGVIKTFTFNGTNFSPGADIPLGGTFSGKSIHDVRYNSNDNLLYVTGDGVVGTYIAALSTTCNVSSYSIVTSQTCTSATVTVTPSAGLNPLIFTYVWTDSVGNILSQTNASSSLTNTLSGIADGTYIIQVQWNTNCGGSAVSDTVVIHCSSVTLTLHDTIICAGQTVTLTATPSVGGGTYLWNPGGGTGQSITVTPATTTTYSVTYTPLTGAPVTGTVTVTVNSNPVTVSVNNASECSGESATLTATPSVGGGTYSWAPGGYTTSSITVLPAANTTYTVTYTSGCGTATGTGLVTLQPAPTETLTQIGTTCGATNGVIDVTAGSGTAPYQYSLNGGAYQLPDSFTNLSSAFYTVKVQDANGCTVSDTISVTVSAGVTVSLTGTSPACGAGNGQITVNAVGGLPPYQYSLNGGAYQASNTFSNVAIGFYTVQVKDAAGCTASDTITLGQGAPVSITLTADSVKCFGANSGMVFGNATGGVLPYQFSLNGGPYQGMDTFQVAAGNYTVTVKDQAGCTANASISVFQPTPLVIDSIRATRVKCPGDKNGTITVFAHGGTQPYNYSCTKDFTNFEYATNGLIIDLDTGFYYVLLSDDNGCTLTDTTYVPNAIPDVYTITTDSTSCYGSQYNDGAIHITGAPFINAPFQYSLGTSAFQLSGDFFSLTAGLYNITAKDSNGCTTVISNIVVPEPLKAFASVLPSDTTLQLGQSIQLITQFWPFPSSTVVSYLWTPILGLSCIDCPNPTVTSYVRDNSYTVTITYNDHCTVDASVTVVVLDNPEIFIPNSFTPNGDGNNDVFLIYGENIKTLNLKIFNRWGELVFESNTQWKGWDGTYKNVLQNPAVFVYETSITLLDDKKIFRKGSVTLIR